MDRQAKSAHRAARPTRRQRRRLTRFTPCAFPARATSCASSATTCCTPRSTCVARQRRWRHIRLLSAAKTTYNHDYPLRDARRQPATDRDRLRPSRRTNPPLLEQRARLRSGRFGPEPATRRLHVAALERPRPDARRSRQRLEPATRLQLTSVAPRRLGEALIETQLPSRSARSRRGRPRRAALVSLTSKNAERALNVGHHSTTGVTLARGRRSAKDHRSVRARSAAHSLRRRLRSAGTRRRDRA